MAKNLSRRNFLKLLVGGLAAVASGLAAVVVGVSSVLGNNTTFKAPKANIALDDDYLDDDYLEQLADCYSCLNQGNLEKRCLYREKGSLGSCQYFELENLDKYGKTYP